MDSTLAAPKSHNLPNFIAKNYSIALNQSIESFSSSNKNPNSQNSPNFASDFQELVQAKSDPLLETIWIYSALTFNAPKIESLSRVSEIKDLFQLIVSCSASCNPVKSIALMAPVVYNVHKFVKDLKGFQLGSKKERKVNGEIKSLVDSVLGYISVCCNGFDGNFDELDGLIRPLGDLISFWLVDGEGQNKNAESLRLFFPLLSDGVAKRAVFEGCGIIDLAGFVIAEAFLLKLCWKVREEGFGEKMQNELRSWMVGSITGLRSSYFYVTLLSMILEPTLPMNSLVNLEHENGLREVLFDALIMVEYSFLSPESLGKLPAKHAKQIIFTKLLAAHEVIELFRKNGDQTKAISYSEAFANSRLPGLIIEWIKSETGDGEGPTGSSPIAFIKWLLSIEDRGAYIFDDDMSKFRTAFDPREVSEQLANMEEEGKAPDSNILFYIDQKGNEEYGSNDDEKMRESMSAAFTDVAHSMQSSEKRGEKRKVKGGKKKTQPKFVKYNVLEHSLLSRERDGDRSGDHLESESDLENPSSDED